MQPDAGWQMAGQMNGSGFSEWLFLVCFCIEKAFMNIRIPMIFGHVTKPQVYTLVN